jgi:hypothetical protein
VGQRSVDFEGFASNASLFFGLEEFKRAHVVETVGKFDDDDAKVGDHGEKHLADVFCLMVFAVCELDFVELGNAFNDVRDLLTEAARDFCGGNVSVFYCIVQKACSDGGGIHFQFCEDDCDFKRVPNVELTGGAELACMLLNAEVPCGANEIEIVIGTI